MSSASCLVHPAPRFRVRLLPLPSSVAARPLLGFRPRCGAPAKGWALWHVSCFKNGQDGPTTSDEGDDFKYVAQSQSSGGAEVKKEEVSSLNGEQEQNLKDGDGFLQLQKASLICLNCL
ncbi:uncharacterized protein [Zea mays]|uniref:Uncharacterized protein n=2 Tax=Zea mays TaxID=4577 RepID=A0A1D6IL14_MAIZE|nr:uncharacterized protein LOC103634419 [Zea mays]ONM60094.1 hypothetical protein ZEAMMB73_Zm00001d022311 [Zea mays]|eukprot:XP_020396854.1 uncharacterized protein LOC103634419 [Zea mays]